MLNFVKATQEHINAMKGKIRDIDRVECWASNHLPIDVCLQRAFETSVLCWVIEYDDKPVCVFGVAPYTLLSSRGVPWLLATDGLTHKIAQMAAKRSKQYIDSMLKRFSLLENHVHYKNRTSVEWLEWCGFHIEPAKPYGMELEPFHKFWKIREGANYV